MDNPDRSCAPNSGPYNLKFTSDLYAEQEEAKAICRRQCPVQQQCLRYALDNDERHHVWAGYLMSSELERRHARQGRTTPFSQKAAQVRELWEQGLNDAQIAEQIGVNPSTVADHRLRQDLPPNAWRGRPRKTEVAA